MDIKQHTTEQLLGQRIKEEIKRYIKTNENDNTTYQNMKAAAKAVIEVKFIALPTSKNKKNLKLTILKELEKEQTKAKVSRRKEKLEQN